MSQTSRSPEAKPTDDSSTCSEHSSTTAKMASTRQMAVAPLMAIRLQWTAASSHYARRAMWDLADQLRGAKLSALRPQSWTVHWTVWQGLSESKLNASSTNYGCTLWVHPQDA